MDFNERLEARLGESTVSESRPTDVIGVISRIGKVFEDTIGIHGMGDGAVGLFRDADGQAYEIQIRPAKYGQFRETLGAAPDPKKAKRREKANKGEWDSNRIWRNKLRGKPDLPG